MKPAVILYKKLPDDLRARLADYATITEINDLSPESQQQHAQALQQAEGMLGSGGKVNGELLAKMPALRACSSVSVGYDNFDVDALNQRGVVLMHTPTVLTETVADTIMALVLSTARRIPELDAWVKAGNWQKSIGPDRFGMDVHHKTMGIFWYGTHRYGAGPACALRIRHEHFYNARRQHDQAESQFAARRCELETLLKESDFVCISLPLTEETHHLIGAEQLAMMKPSAVLINAGRGPVVDENALITALQEGTIHAAGLDVFEKEPLPADSPLLSLPNVVTLPHIGSATHETRYGMMQDAVENLIAAMSGKVEKNCVNPQVLEVILRLPIAPAGSGRYGGYPILYYKFLNRYGFFSVRRQVYSTFRHLTSDGRHGRRPAYARHDHAWRRQPRTDPGNERLFSAVAAADARRGQTE